MWIVIGIVFLVFILGVVIHDITQRKHAILHNFPIVGHFRYLLESVGPELRQYIVTGNDEERPFSRDQRRWVYASSKRENNYFGFGTDNDLDLTPNYLIIKHSPFPLLDPPEEDPLHRMGCKKVMGGARQRAKAFTPESVIYVSGMSYGSLGRAAVEAINRGCGLAHALHNTGEGGLSRHHLHGGDLVLQLGTAYFGVRDAEGRFSLSKLKELVEKTPQIKAIEIKLSQGAKPGLGGLLPAAKITPEIAAVRGIPMNQDCHSPSRHSAFSDADSMLDFIELLAAETGLPVGIKSAIGQLEFWNELARLCASRTRMPDFIVVDGAEGGTGAAPLVHADHVALPFKLAITRILPIFRQQGLADDIVFCGSGRLGFPDQALLAFALGCDMIGVAREAMLSIGCIQAQRCHTDFCPAGVATHNEWLMKGLDPEMKAARLANYLCMLRKEITKVCRSCGVAHPSEMKPEFFELLDGNLGSRGLDTWLQHL